MMIDNEIWKPVLGFESLYEVSNKGRIKALPKPILNPRTGTYNTRKEKMLKAWLEIGYYRVGLFNGKHVYLFVHRVVARAFVEGYRDGLHVNHKDGNKLNNDASNLEWVTPKENVRHSLHVLKKRGGRRVEIIDTDTGVFFFSIREAHAAKAFKHHLSYTVRMLGGGAKNTTSLIRLL